MRKQFGNLGWFASAALLMPMSFVSLLGGLVTLVGLADFGLTKLVMLVFG